MAHISIVYLASALCLAFPAVHGYCGGTQSYIGDGYCDSDNNNAGCNWDGGDCCEESCIDSTHTCATTQYGCLDPKYATTTTTTTTTTTLNDDCDVSFPSNLGNGRCNSYSNYNTADCNWDNGDCCEETCVDSATYTCGGYGYDCLDPQYATTSTTSSCGSIDYDSSSGTCSTQCYSHYGSCSQTTYHSSSVNGIVSVTCECCDCGSTDTDTDSDSSCHSASLSYSYSSCSDLCVDRYGSCGTIQNINSMCHCCRCGESSSNGCDTIESGTVDNPLKEKSGSVYIFVCIFFFVCVVPLYICSLKLWKAAEEQDKKNFGCINKLIGILDENGQKQNFCRYLRWNHSIFKLCCGSKLNRWLVWASFVFDNVLVFSLSILLASISATQRVEKCFYQSGGSTVQSTTAKSDEGGFEYNFTNTVITLVIKYIFGFFIGRVVGTTFKEKSKGQMKCCVLLIIITVLFLIVTIIIRTSVELTWNLVAYSSLFVFTQTQDVFYEMFNLYGKYLIGKCCVEEPIQKNLAMYAENQPKPTVNALETVVVAPAPTAPPIEAQSPTVIVYKQPVQTVHPEVQAQPQPQPVQFVTQPQPTVVISQQPVAVVQPQGDASSDLPKGWRVAYTADNRKYYQNDITRQTSWEMPTEQDDENEGAVTFN
eukprot:62967_1